MDTVSRSEATEKELDNLIGRRDQQRRRDEGERDREALWVESVQTFNARQQQDLAWEWLRYHVARQRAHRRTFALLDAHHEQEIRRYSEMLGINYDKGDDAA